MNTAALYTSLFFLALSIVLIILGSITANGGNKIPDNTSKNNVKRASAGIIVIGVLFFILSALSLFYLFKNQS
jgi:hypothetical protein